MFNNIGEFFKDIIGKINILAKSFMSSKYFFIYIPAFVFCIGFLETVGIVGLFLPSDLIVITVLALFVNNLKIFFLGIIFYGIGMFTGLLVGYLLGKGLLNKLFIKFEDKFPNIKSYSKQADDYVQKYHLWAFPILINIGFIRPIVSIYFGTKKYDFKKYVLGSVAGTFAYIIPRAIIGYLVGIFGKIVFDYLKIGYKYVVYIALGLIAISLIVDIFVGEKELGKGHKTG